MNTDISTQIMSGGDDDDDDYNHNNGYFERLTWMLTLSAYISKHPSIDNKDSNAAPHTHTHTNTHINRAYFRAMGLKKRF